MTEVVIMVSVMSSIIDIILMFWFVSFAYSHSISWTAAEQRQSNTEKGSDKAIGNVLAEGDLTMDRDIWTLLQHRSD